MSTQLEEPAVSIRPGIDLDIDMVTSLRIDPGGLDGYLKLVGDSRGPLIKYRDGSLTLVSPSHRHERGAERIDGLIKAVCAVLGHRLPRDRLDALPPRGVRPRDRGGQDLLHRTRARRARGRGRDRPDARTRPPTWRSRSWSRTIPPKSLAICQELGVPEVWVYRVRRGSVEFLHRDAQGQYAPAPASRAFPFLTPADVLPWIESIDDEPDNFWEERLRAWVRDELGPRRPRRQ